MPASEMALALQRFGLHARVRNGSRATRLHARCEKNAYTMESACMALALQGGHDSGCMQGER